MTNITLGEFNHLLTPSRAIKFILAAGVLYIGLLVLTPFPHYLPPNFDEGFLRGKAEFFYSTGYFVGFYAHILTAPVGLLIGTLQLSRTLRTRFVGFHRGMGRVYVAVVLLGVSPGGLIMALKAYGDLSSTICFALIAILLWVATWNAWREARAMRFRQHGQWMCRSYLLLCSAILLRLISVVFNQTSLDHTFRYQLAAWLSWLPGMILLEIVIARRNAA